jgi:hypothetical protein
MESRTADIGLRLPVQKKVRLAVGRGNRAVMPIIDYQQTRSDPAKTSESRQKSHQRKPTFTAKIKFMKVPEARKIESAYLEEAITYEAYTTLIADVLSQGRTTGPDQSEAMVHYTQLNQQRMHRQEKSMVLLPSAETLILSIGQPQTWLVLTEAWCGDASQSIPVMHALAVLNPLIELKFLLRDENLPLMDRYLTNGVSRSIPKLIGIDTTTSEEIFTWGPRPAPLQAIFMEMKAAGLEHRLMVEEFQRWYNKDKTVTLQQELSTIASSVAGASVGMTA